MTHLVKCEDCRLYWEDQLAIHEAMTDMTATVPAGFADNVMARVRETKQDRPEKKIISFPERFAGLAACCAVVLLGIFAANSGFLSTDNYTTSNCAAPEMSYSLMNETQTADAAIPTEEAELENFSLPPAAAGGGQQPRSEADNGACATDAAPFGTVKASSYAQRITTESEIAAQWVEDTLGQTWISGTCYSLTAEEYAELLSLLENSGETFELCDGTADSELYQLLAR